MMALTSAMNSLRVRLPLLVSATVAIVLALFLWATRQTLDETMLAAGADRATAAADQVTTLLTQSTSRTMAETRRIASEPLVRDFLLEPRRPAAAVRKVLSPLATPSQPGVALFDRHGERLLEVAAATTPPSGLIADTRREAFVAGLGRFRQHDGTITYEFAAEVRGDPAAAAASEHLGWIVVRRNIVASQNADAVRRLVGDEAVLLIGNREDAVWTNLAETAAPPLIERTTERIAEYRDAQGRDWLGALRFVPDTPWAVWVAFPRDVILESADTAFRGMVGVAITLVLVAAAVIAVTSRRLTRPLLELTAASEAMAAGDFDQRVRATGGDEIGRLGVAFNSMVTQVADAHRTLEDRVRERTASLQRANDELEAFSYSVSHDLRAPLRHVVGFAGLLQQSGAALGEKEQRYMATIVEAATRMGRLIDDLLAFSRVGRTALNVTAVDLGQVTREAQREVLGTTATDAVQWNIGDLPVVSGDRALLRLVMVNLLSNAVKYSAMRTPAAIEVGAIRESGEVVVFVRDNGVGFDMEYVEKLFGVFQRLHRHEEFEGTGIGLANVRRIVARHGGRTWAEGRVGEGATFCFSLPGQSAGVDQSGGARADERADDSVGGRQHQ